MVVLGSCGLWGAATTPRDLAPGARRIASRCSSALSRDYCSGFDGFKEAGLLPGESEEDRKASYWWSGLNIRVEVGQRLYELLKTIKGLWLIVDLHEDKYTDGHPECRVALFSSLRADKFKGFAGGGGGSVPLLHMPVRTLNEASRCVSALPQLGMTKREVAERFTAFGGCACFSTPGNTRATIEDQLRRDNTSNLSSVLDPSGTARTRR